MWKTVSSTGRHCTSWPPALPMHPPCCSPSDPPGTPSQAGEMSLPPQQQTLQRDPPILLVSLTFLMGLQGHSGTANSCTNSAILLLLLFIFSSAPWVFQSCHWHLGHTKDAVGSWETSVPALIPAAAIRAWVTSVAGCYGNCSATLGAANTSPVCSASSFTHQCSAGRAGSLFLRFGFHSAAQHCRTRARTSGWSSTPGLHPELHFALSEGSHSFQGSLDHTILCQWP